MNRYLMAGGLMSLLAAFLHIAIIMGGPDWYRFFGAGEKMAHLAETGSWIPTVSTLFIFAVLFIWGLYGFSGAGLMRRLPLVKMALLTITAIYLLRGMLLFILLIFEPVMVDSLMLWSSLVCLGMGTAYACGTRQVWSTLNP